MKPRKAIIYTRYSPRRNGEDCESGRTQLAMCRDYCREKGYTVTGEHHDALVSGATKAGNLTLTDDAATVDLKIAERPGLWGAVDAVRRNGVLVVWRLDRLARDVLLSEIIHRQAVRRHWTVEAIDGYQPDDTPENAFMRHILDAVSTLERAIIAAQTRATMQAMSRGRRIIGNLAYGQEYSHSETGTLADGSKKVMRFWKPCASELALIDLIIELKADGATLQEVADKLLAMKLLTRKGKKWHINTIWRILKRAAEQSQEGGVES